MSGFCSRHQGHDPTCDICTATDGIPKGLADALAYAADWLDTYDKMGVAFFDFLARSDLPPEMREQAASLIPVVGDTLVQEDLRAWSAQVRSAEAAVDVPTLTQLRARAAVTPRCICDSWGQDIECDVHFPAQAPAAEFARRAEKALPILLGLFAERPVGGPDLFAPRPEVPRDENGMDSLS